MSVQPSVEDDFVYHIHRDFVHRTKGKTTATIQSAVGGYHINVPLCMSILNENQWRSATMEQMQLLRRGVLGQPVISVLRLEISRRQIVCSLVRRISEIVHTMQRSVPSNKRPPFTALHQIIELLTGWILHERNDPEQEKLWFKLSSVTGNEISPDTLYHELFPVQVQRSFVLASDVGQRVSSESDVGLLARLVNNWRGVVEADTGGHKEYELRDLQLIEPASSTIDILLPAPDLNPRGSSTAVFVRLTKWAGGEKNAANIASLCVTNAVHDARKALLAAKAEVDSVAEVAEIQISEEEAVVGGETVDIVEIRYRQIRCPMLKRAWDKMRCLYRANVSCEEEDTEQLFAARLLTVLIRYASLSGGNVQNVDQTAGFHAAVPPLVYSKMRETLHTAVEGFASPMNSTSTNFCSLFPDCDSFFGSLGSFFHLSMRKHFPNGISMSCNPPYSVIVMLRVGEQLTALFDEAEVLGVPLQVFVVVCNWDISDSPSAPNSGKRILDQLACHPYCVHHKSLPPNEAPFQDGHAFVLNRPFFTLASNTEVFFFQNRFADSKWPNHRTTGFFDVVHLWTSLKVKEVNEEDNGEKKRPRSD